ncbi:caspase family protein [Fodinibius saliphilus]|uniref:caspase family protein n=1 Tax=Fodinibius saliphilus TaxID=1920650 RepID=UPI001109238D|nr:caspase family protein [Fodinibius saliphilus]
MQRGEVSPSESMLSLDLMARTKYRYTQRVLAQRNIQKYKLRPGFIAVGLSGAALAFIAANSNAVNKTRSKARMWTLNAVGTTMVAAGFLNMKAVGTPRTTGEERFLKKSGNIVRIDTVAIKQTEDATAYVSVQYQDSTIRNEEIRALTDGQLQIPLSELLNDQNIAGPDPGNVSISIQFKDSLYEYKYPVYDILEPYAQVVSRITSLRNSTDNTTTNNIVADLGEGSQVKIASTKDDEWFRVMYGISEHFIHKEDAEIVWRSSDFNQQDQLVTVPRLPFGEVDVETNIPVLRTSKDNAIALIIANKNYSGRYKQRSYAHRDARLIKTYLQTSLGYKSDNIFDVREISSRDTLNMVLSRMRSIANDSTELSVFISGYGEVDSSSGNSQLKFLGVNDIKEEATAVLDLEKLFKTLSKLTKEKTIILSDIDFSQSMGTNISVLKTQRILESSIRNLGSEDKWSVLFGAQLNQASQVYISSTGSGKKHHIFPYFFAKALQNRITDLSEIHQYLERNVSYTARKLHDTPQDPLLLGNTLLDLGE